MRALDYYGAFQCLAGACPHSCCTGWEVEVDEETALRYFAVPGPLGDRLRAALQHDGEGFVFPLNGGRCPFLDGEGLCEIHRLLGEAATSDTCHSHPRFIEDYGAFREVSLAASCPAACALLLGSRGPLRIVEAAGEEPPCGEGDPWLAGLLPLRSRMLGLLEDRGLPLRRRLAAFLRLAWEAQTLLDGGRGEDLAALAAAWEPEDGPAAEGPGLFPAALRFLGTLEALDPDWRTLLARAERAPAHTAPEDLLERIACYFAFRYLLKAVNDGDLLSRAQLCVLAALAVDRLAALTGLPEALRRFCREIEHSQENLDALQAAFWQREELGPARFWEELSL